MMLKRRRAITFAVIGVILAAFSLPLIMFTPAVKAAVLYDSGNPTSAEQLVLEYINRARSDPVAEGRRLGIDIHEGLLNPNLVGPRPPLAMNKLLIGVAHKHSQDMYTMNYFSHDDPNGTTPFGRIIHAGYDYAMAGENMAAAGASETAADLEDFMMVDSGTQGRPHRVNLLDLINPYPCGGSQCIYSEVGVGYFDGATPNGIGISSLITEDFGLAVNTGPFLLGVVYNDLNNNHFYDIGEGISGVTITLSTGGYYAVSSISGGYAIPIGTSGTITVTASGPGFGPVSKTVTLTGTNIKVDFTSQASSTTSAQSTISSAYPSITFQSVPSSFAGATSGTITACGSTYTNAQTSSACGSGFTATANLPAPSTGWQFNHWTWTGGVSCYSSSANPVTCSASASGSLTAVYGAQVTFVTNPASMALIGWGSCPNPTLGNGASFFSTNYGSARVTLCYVPSGYVVSNWSCSAGLACSGSNNSTMVTLTGPGMITLNLQTQTSPSSTVTASSVMFSASTMLTVTTSLSSLTSTLTTYSTTEFGFSQNVMIGAIIAVFLIICKTRK